MSKSPHRLKTSPSSHSTLTGAWRRLRLSRRGNRTLNHAIHMIAVTQIRNLGSEGRVYYDTKLAAGRTKREAMRSLKRHISDRVYRQLRINARTK